MASVATTPGAQRQAFSRISERTAVQGVRWATIVAVVAVWELLCRGPLAHNGYLAAPSVVLTDGLPGIMSPDALQGLGHTTLRFLIAFALTALLGTLLGLTIGRTHHHMFAGLRDVVSVLYSLPMAPFYPLFVLWLGLGDKSEVAFGVIHGVIPVILLGMTASASIPTNYITASRTMGASRRQRMRLVMLPAVTPQLISALKIGAALTLLGILLAELMISVGGVGSFMAANIASQQAAPLDAMVLVVCVGAFLTNAALSATENRASRWERDPA